MIRTVEYGGFSDCLEISNGKTSVTVATQFGPRILAYTLDGGDNVLGWHPDAAVDTPLGRWRPYGGHRLWIAPENMPRSYAPDDRPVDVTTEAGLSVRLKGAVDAAGVEKEIIVTLADNGSSVTLDHRLTVSEKCEGAAWALTIMRPGGTVVIPNEPFAPYSSENLLPVRSAALWSYTDLTDPRWEFTKEAVRLRVDESIGTQQKIGVMNRRGWVRYECNDLVFTKRGDFIPDAGYPDMNSSFEVYTAGGFVEIETLSPLRRIGAGETIEHREEWVITTSASE